MIVLNTLLQWLFHSFYSVVLAKQAEKKAILERIEQGKKAAKNKKRSRAPNGIEVHEPSAKRSKPRAGSGQYPLEVGGVSNSPSPLTLSTSRPTSVLSAAGAILDVMNGDDSSDMPGSTDGSEVNSEISGPGMTPVRKAQAKSKLGRPGISTVAIGDYGGGGSLLQVPSTPSPSGNASRSVKQTSAPLGGRGKIAKSIGKKAGGKGSGKGGSAGSAAASAGARAGAKAATNAAYAAYGIPISPSPANSPVASASVSLPAGYNQSSQSAHSSPPGSPVPMAFVATSLVSTSSMADHPSPSSK